MIDNPTLRAGNLQPAEKWRRLRDGGISAVTVLLYDRVPTVLIPALVLKLLERNAMSVGSSQKTLRSELALGEAPAEQVGALEASKGTRSRNSAETKICTVFVKFVVRQEMR